MTHNPYIRNKPECDNGASCCCDVCTHAKVLCLGECCRCVPRIMCFVLEPIDPYSDCRTYGMLVVGGGGSGGYSGPFFGSLFSPQEDNDFGLSPGLDDSDPYNPVCKWVFTHELSGTVAEFTIGDGYTTCHSPTFDIPISNSYCDWMLHIYPYELAKVPFDGPPFETCYNTTEACTVTATWSWVVDTCPDTCHYVAVPIGALPCAGAYNYKWELDSSNCLPGCDCPTLPDPCNIFASHPADADDTMDLNCVVTSADGHWELDSVDDPDCDCAPDPPVLDGTIDGETDTTSCNTTRDITICGNTAPFQCGDCDSVCVLICVRYEWEGESIRKEFTWNPALSQWEHELGDVFDVIQIGEYAGQCYLSFSIEDFEGANIEFADIPVDLCGIGLDIEVTSLLGEVTVGVSCNPCTCYKLHCGTCRCACSELCVVLFDDGVATLYEMPWTTAGPDGQSGWIDDDSGYFIALVKDPDTNGCVLVVPDMGEYPIDDCGTGIQIELNDYQGNYAGFVLCKQCVCSLGLSTCCHRDLNSPDFPLVLFATLTSVALCSCAGSTFACYFNPFAGWWIGSGSLGSCDDPTGIPSYIKIRIECNVTQNDELVIVIHEVCCGSNGVGGQLCGEGDCMGESTVLSCDPIHALSCAFIVDRSCCNDEPMAGGTLQVEVTE